MTMPTALAIEVTTELLEDFGKAIVGIAGDVLPGRRVSATIERRGPTPRLIIEFGEMPDGYPAFVPARALLRPTDNYRRRLGLPVPEEG